MLAFYFTLEGGESMNIVDPIRDKDDIQAMKEYLREWNERNYLLFLFGINSGLRVGDILRIRVKDVQGWYIKIKEQKTGKRKQLKMTKTLKKKSESTSKICHCIIICFKVASEKTNHWTGGQSIGY